MEGRAPIVGPPLPAAGVASESGGDGHACGDGPTACAEHPVLRQDMTISRDAFLRNLPGAVGHAPFRAEGDEFVHGEATRGWRIRFCRLPDRRIASLALERHAVELYLRGYDAADERAFLDRFELHFRRGGG